MNNKLDKILAEISAGELIDKITILEIKKTKINDGEKLKNIEKELSSLNETFKKVIPKLSEIKILIDKLKSINLKLWDIENAKRLAEKNNNFDEKFIELSRSVYKNNDERAKLKLEINNILGSNIKEVKSHY
jgi:predicted nuclease with TOPRIM domain